MFSYTFTFVQGSPEALMSRADSQKKSRKPVELSPGFRRCLLKAEVFCENVFLGRQGFLWENTQQALYGKISVTTGKGGKFCGCLLAVLCYCSLFCSVITKLCWITAN